MSRSFVARVVTGRDIKDHSVFLPKGDSNAHANRTQAKTAALQTSCRV